MAPETLMELIKCSGRSSCKVNDMSCTELCKCEASSENTCLQSFFIDLLCRQTTAQQLSIRNPQSPDTAVACVCMHLSFFLLIDSIAFKAICLHVRVYFYTSSYQY